MKNKNQFSRRTFIGSLSGLWIGSHFLTQDSHSASHPEKKNLWAPLTDDENVLIQRSTMAPNILNYSRQGYSCAGCILSSSLALLGKPKEINHVASCFGGGMGRYDVCGYITGAHMAIGVSAGMIHADVRERKIYAHQVSDTFWEWWDPLAPVDCKNLKSNCNLYYGRMIKRVALKVEELIEPALAFKTG